MADKKENKRTARTIDLSRNEMFAGTRNIWTGRDHYREMALDSVSVKVTVDGETVEVTIPSKQFVMCTTSVMFQTPAYVLARMLHAAMNEAGVPEPDRTLVPEFLYVVTESGNFGVRPIASNWRDTVSETDEGYRELTPKEFARLALRSGVKRSRD